MLFVVRKPCFKVYDGDRTSPVNSTPEVPQDLNLPNIPKKGDIAYNAEGMAVAAQFISQSFDVFKTTCEQMTEQFDSYIPGDAIKSPTFSQNLNNLWHETVDDGLVDFMNNYNEWSDVISLVNATGADLTDEATAIYASDGLAGEVVEGLGAATMMRLLDAVGGVNLTLEQQQNVDAITDINIRYNTDTARKNREYYESYGNLSPEEQRAVDKLNQEAADSHYRFYELYRSGEDNSVGSNETMALSQNPDVVKLMEERYASEHKDEKQ